MSSSAPWDEPAPSHDAVPVSDPAKRASSPGSSAPVDELIQLGGHRIRVRVQGEGRPLLLINGVGAPLELWQPMVARLRGVRAITFDAPGSGGSSTPNVPLSIGGHADLVLGLLDALDCPRAAALGYSFGGMVAQELAVRAGPQRIDRLVLASTMCGWGGVPGSPAALLEVSNPERYYPRTIFAGLTPTARDSDRPRGFGHELVRGVLQPSGRGYRDQLWAAATWSSVLWLHRVRQPTLVITGDVDTLVPSVNGQILNSMLPNGRLHLVRGGGHFCLFERMDETVPLLTDFLVGGASISDTR